MEITKQVKECIHRCDFYWSSMDGMECTHPSLDGTTYESMIISQSDRGKIPEKCPLRKEDLVIRYVLGENDE